MTGATRSAWVLTELAPDGSAERAATFGEAGESDGTLELGRSATGLAYPDDDMADRQVRLVDSGTGVVLEDLAEGAGLWLRITGGQGRALMDGDQVWLGAQVLIFRRTGTEWLIRHHGPDGRLRETYPVPPSGLFLGRGSEWVLDAEDAQLSRRHAQVAFVDDALRYFDRGAQNGSFIRLRTPEVVAHGAEFRVATRRFRLEQRPVELEPPEPASPDPQEDASASERDEPRQESTLPMGPSSETLPDSGRESPFEEATVLSLPVGDEPPEAGPPAAPPPGRPLPESGLAGRDSAESARPRPALGLGARLRRLGRPSAEPETNAPSEAPPASELGTLVVPIAPSSATGSGSSPDAPRTAADTQAPRGAEPVEAPAAGERVPLVLDSPDGSVVLEVEPGVTVLEAVQQAGLARGRPVDWECGDGGCGVCIVGVVEGADRMDPPDPASGEMQTIQITEQVAPDPTRYRLACLARVRGAVRLRKLT